MHRGTRGGLAVDDEHAQAAARRCACASEASEARADDSYVIFKARHVAQCRAILRARQGVARQIIGLPELR
jgi:hypothetical protein